MLPLSSHLMPLIVMTLQEDESVPEDTSDKADEEDVEVNDLAKDKLIKALKPKGAKAKEKEKPAKKK